MIKNEKEEEETKIVHERRKNSQYFQYFFPVEFYFDGNHRIHFIRKLSFTVFVQLIGWIFDFELKFKLSLKNCT